MSEQTMDFITLRQPERISEKVKRLRYIRDLRLDAVAPIREQLKNTDVYRQKILIALAFANTPLFFTVDRYYSFKYETIVGTLRELLTGPRTTRDAAVAGVEIATVIAALEDRLPTFRDSNFFSAPTLPPGVLGGLFLQYASVWESLYCVVVMAGIVRQETNHLIDAIRAMHVLALLRRENMKQPPTATWPYYDFDAYDAMVDDRVVTYSHLT